MYTSKQVFDINMEQKELTNAIANYQPKKISIWCSPPIIFVKSMTTKKNKYVKTKHFVQST